jgi:hypothetical protein
MARLTKDGPFPLREAVSSKFPGIPQPKPPIVVSFVEVGRGVMQGPPERKQVVIGDWKSFDLFFDGKPPAEKPQVNFETEQLIAVSMGERPSGGYDTAIVAVLVLPGWGLPMVEVDYVENSAHGIEPDVLTHPWHMVKCKKLAGRTVFRKLELNQP